MKNQALFSSKDKNKNLKCRLLQFLFGALRVNAPHISFQHYGIFFLKQVVLTFSFLCHVLTCS